MKQSISAFISGSRAAKALGGTGGGGIVTLGASLGGWVDFICEDALGLGAFDSLRGLGLGAIISSVYRVQG